MRCWACSTRKVLENGIPDEAYTALSGDDKATASGAEEAEQGRPEELESHRRRRPVCPSTGLAQAGQCG